MAYAFDMTQKSNVYGQYYSYVLCTMLFPNRIFNITSSPLCLSEYNSPLVAIRCMPASKYICTRPINILYARGIVSHLHTSPPHLRFRSRLYISPLVPSAFRADGDTLEPHVYGAWQRLASRVKGGELLHANIFQFTSRPRRGYHRP